MAKKVLRSLMEAYDYVLYALWRSFEVFKPEENINNFPYKPLISIVVPTYNTDHDFLKQMIMSVKKQLYANWELVLVDDASPDNYVRQAIQQEAQNDHRIKYTFLPTNHHIAEATNVGIKTSTGDYIGLLDHDDIIYPHTLLEVVKAINAHMEAKFFYSDEDKIIGKKRIQPLFKPSWNLGLLHAVNYITHFAVIKKEVLEKLGGEDGSYNGAQDWELFLRIGRNLREEEIIHIPKILYSWRMHPLSTSTSLDAKPYVLAAQLKAVREDLRARKISATVERNKKYPGQLVLDGQYMNQLDVKGLYSLIGIKRTIFVILSSRMALSRHVYRTIAYDKITSR